VVIKDRSLAGFYGPEPVHRIEDIWIYPLHDMEILTPSIVPFPTPLFDPLRKSTIRNTLNNLRLFCAAGTSTFPTPQILQVL
jgi:hypothetical protein